MKKGLVHIYTGDGKGKTTCAIGLGIRAAGRGNKVYMVQFLKSGSSGELMAIEKSGLNFNIFRFESKKGFFWNLNDEQKKELKKEVAQEFEFIKRVVKEKECDLLILDEIMGVISNKLLKEEEVLKLIENKAESMEIVLTGRNAPKILLDAADYVSDIRCAKHPFEKGIQAREGIEY